VIAGVTIMKKNTKKVRLINTTAGSYFCYDLDPDKNGYVKRLYARTEEELVEKIDAARKLEELKNLRLAPDKNALISDLIKFYFRCRVGKVPSQALKVKSDLATEVIYSSEIDIPLKDLNLLIIQAYFDRLSSKYTQGELENIKALLGEAIKNAGSHGIKSKIDLNLVSLPKDRQFEQKNYILSTAQHNRLAKFCISEETRQYSLNIMAIAFILYTGLMPVDSLRLKVSDFNMRDRALTLNTPKGNSVLRLEEDFAKFCDGWLFEREIKNELQSEKTDLFFESDGHIPKANSIGNTLTRIALRLGLPKGITCRSLQKSYVLRQLENGEKWQDIEKRLFLKKDFVADAMTRRTMQNEFFL
jgi:integrase